MRTSFWIRTFRLVLKHFFILNEQIMCRINTILLPSRVTVTPSFYSSMIISSYDAFWRLTSFYRYKVCSKSRNFRNINENMNSFSLKLILFYHFQCHFNPIDDLSTNFISFQIQTIENSTLVWNFKLSIQTLIV